MKRYIEGADPGGNRHFSPECLDDRIAENNPVRAVDTFVDALDLAELGFKAQPGSSAATSGIPL